MERPILFSTAMVKAILEDRKTQTRRVVKHFNLMGGNETPIQCPYQVSDILWVRETFSIAMESTDYVKGIKKTHYSYRADNFAWGNTKFHPSIHMPRKAARLFLKIADIRVERLQDISEEDARAEGCIDFHDKIGDGKFADVLECDLTARDAFVELWDSINQKRGCGWDVNPWVWVISFERAQP